MGLARLIESKSHIIPGKLRVSELFFDVPKDHNNPSSGTLRLFARSVTKNEKPASPMSEDDLRKTSQKPWFVYLQGGPGFGCRPPQNMGMTKIVLDRGYQMLYLDQRGTGLSTPVSAGTLALQGSARSQADYLKLFRADSIVNDCEAIRKVLTEGYPAELKKWTIFGQSFGGFCALNYLSYHPQGLREVFTSGGIPPIRSSAEEVYKATFKQVIKRNKAYYEKYPDDVEAVHRIVLYIKKKFGLQLPSGGKLTVRRFLTLGIAFGAEGGLDIVHDIVQRMCSDLTQFDFVTRPTLASIEAMSPLDDNVLYAVLHESVYCQQDASNWAAERVAKTLDEFQWIAGTPSSPASLRSHPLFFSGEMIFPFMFDTHVELEKLLPVADILAKYKDWPELYDEWQLARNEVPVYSATFVDDMYVDFDLVQNTVEKIRNCKQYITNTMYHDAVRSKTDEVLAALFALRDDSID